MPYPDDDQAQRLFLHGVDNSVVSGAHTPGNFTEAFREQGTEAQEQARDQLIAENEAFAKELKKIRTGH